MNEFQTSGFEVVRSFMNMKPYTSATPLELIQADVDRAQKMLDLVRPFAQECTDSGFKLEHLDRVLGDWKSYHWKVVERACLAIVLEFSFSIVRSMAADHDSYEDLDENTPVRTAFIKDFFVIYDAMGEDFLW